MPALASNLHHTEAIRRTSRHISHLFYIFFSQSLYVNCWFDFDFWFANFISSSLFLGNHQSHGSRFIFYIFVLNNDILIPINFITIKNIFYEWMSNVNSFSDQRVTVGTWLIELLQDLHINQSVWLEWLKTVPTSD